MKLEKVQVDVSAQEEGDWREHPYFDGISVLVCGSSSERVEKRRRDLLNRRANRRMKPGDAIFEGRRVEALCTAEALLDVKGFDDVTYTQELGRAWAVDPKMRRFMDGVRELQDEIGTEEQKAHEESVED